MIDNRNNYYKIGKSIKPKSREKTLQSEVPSIQLIDVFKGYGKLEKKLHSRFKDKRVRGEWFSLSTNDICSLKNEFESDLSRYIENNY